MLRRWYDLSNRWKVAIPILTIGLALMVIVYLFERTNLEKQIIKTSIEKAEIISDQIRNLREYYTSNVVSVAKNNGMDVTHDYSQNNTAIPLPATLVHDLSKLSSDDQGYNIRLFSAFPFPFREDGGIKDSFGKDALEFLSSNPKESYWRVEELGGQTNLRYATADIMVAKTCVKCHNSHPLSPKTDWQIGDVRGVLEVNFPIQEFMTTIQTNAKKSGMFVGFFILFMVVIVVMMIQHFMVGPLQKLAVVGNRIADGDLTSPIKVCSRDEIGLILATIKNMTEKLNSLIGQVQRTGIRVSTSTSQISSGAKELESIVSEQAASTHEIVSTSSQISKTSDQLSQTVDQVHRIVEETADSASRGENNLAHLEGTIHKMENAANEIGLKLAVINEKASNITGVIGTIGKVANQTNLISFNAGIESVKSGKYGERFSIIAKEIRLLADQTASSTRDIKEIIEEMQNAVSEGVAGMDQFSKEVKDGIVEANKIRIQLEEIIKKVQKLAPLYRTVNDGMKSQSEGAKIIKESITELSQGAIRTAESLHETNRSIQELNEVSSNLKEEVSLFKLN